MSDAWTTEWPDMELVDPDLSRRIMVRQSEKFISSPDTSPEPSYFNATVKDHHHG